MKIKKLPNFLQPFLWSVKITDIDLEKDRIYIINQILSFGDIGALRWLYRNYSLGEIKKVFVSHSIKIYRESGFNFVKNILLDINEPLDVKKYVATSF